MVSISSLLLTLSALLLLLLLPPTNPEPTQDKAALQDFLAAVPHSSRLNWDPSTSPCNWTGVQCDPSLSFVTALRLPAAGLVSPIPPNTLSRLSHLRVLSLRNNGLYGALPDDFSNLTLLRSLYLHQNRFSGEFPPSLTLLTHLTRLDLSSNNFSGRIPDKINNLTRLFLQSNNFSGEIPSLNTENLADFNVSENRLNGSIPESLLKFPESSFAGNSELCGGPLPACENNNASSPADDGVVPASPAERGNTRKFSAAAIAGIAVASAVFFLVILSGVVLCLIRRYRRQPAKSPKRGPPASVAAALAAEASSSKEDVTSGAVAGERNKLVFMNGGGGGGYSFDLEDLLRASAEVLGKGSVGTSYKAVLEDGTTVVVKRLKEVTAARREFEMQMEVLGGCVHQNVVPIRAYYFSRDEKLLVCDHFQAGSLSALLHGNKGAGRTSLDWNDRMKTALGAARGLTYLHMSSNVVHGNIKSSNVLLRQDRKEAAVSDFGLNSLFGNSTPQNKGVGYCAPEVVETRKVTVKSDVYSFGVLLLELISGKAPNQTSASEEGVDLPRWVQSVVRDEWTSEVFDRELMRYDNVEEEMVQLLQIAMSCVQTMPDQRPTMPEVLHMMEGVTQGGTDSLRQSLDDSSRGSDGQTQFVGTVDTP